jgi:hypothetical protein
MITPHLYLIKSRSAAVLVAAYNTMDAQDIAAKYCGPGSSVAVHEVGTPLANIAPGTVLAAM